MALSLCTPAWATTVLNYDQSTPGTIASAAQTNSYSLSVNAGDVLNFTVVATKSTSGTLGPCIVLFDPNGKQVDNAGGNYSQDVEMNGYVAESTGTYTVTIQDCAGTATGDYVIFVQKSNDPIGSVPLPYAKVKTGTISSVAESVAYTISANAKDVLNFTVVATSSTSGTLGPCILLYNTTGTPQLDYAGGNYAQDVEMNGYVVPAAGTYNVFIKDCADTATGDYALFVQKSNDPIDSVPIVYDQVQTETIASAAQSNAYTLIGSLNDVLNFTVVATSSTSGTLGPCILLYNATNPQPLDYAGGNYVQTVEMSYRIPATGIYNVFVKDCADTATGTYSLNTECIAAGSSTCQLPVPILTSMSPTTAIAGGPGFILTVYGFGFASVDAKSVVEWNGKPLVTTFVSTTELRAAVPKADIASAGTDWVTVFTPAPGGGTSNKLPFKVIGPIIESVEPSSVTAGGPSFTLTVNGAGFVDGSVVNWNQKPCNASPLTTTYVSATQLTVFVSATCIATAEVVELTVTNPSPGGTSPQFAFDVDNPVPKLISLTPASIIAGGIGFTLTLTGSDFVKGSLVEWNGKGLTTTYVSPTELQATVPASDTLDGDISVTVFNSSPGGGTSNPKTLPIDNPVPVAISLSPASAKSGSGSFTLIVNGFDFNEGAKVQWNGIALSTVFASDMQLQAAVPASDVATAGSATVTVANPAPTPSPSNPLTFTIN
jgi:ABC-type phosphate/phosphonate transport system substrate-binding protein